MSIKVYPGCVNFCLIKPDCCLAKQYQLCVGDAQEGHNGHNSGDSLIPADIPSHAELTPSSTNQGVMDGAKKQPNLTVLISRRKCRRFGGQSSPTKEATCIGGPEQGVHVEKI